MCDLGGAYTHISLVIQVIMPRDGKQLKSKFSQNENAIIMQAFHKHGQQILHYERSD